MRITFNLMSCGLGNNGGSSTLIKSANTLVEMGHEVIMLDSGKNQHTWTPLKAKHQIKEIPEADVVIATGFKTVVSTLALPESAGIKTHWIRAWEHWQMSEQEMINKVVRVPTIKLVNSICLQNKLNSYGEESHIIRPGYDFDLIYPTNSREDNHETTIGALYREGIHGNRKRTDWVIKAMIELRKRHSDLRLLMFGSEPSPRSKGIDLYFRSPTAEQKNILFNRSDIWIAPTMSEGLHLPPAEAMITECPVVGTDAELSGMQDYLIDGITGLVARNDFDHFVDRIDYLIKRKVERQTMGLHARHVIKVIGDRRSNMEKLVDLLRGML